MDAASLVQPKTNGNDVEPDVQSKNIETVCRNAVVCQSSAKSDTHQYKQWQNGRQNPSHHLILKALVPQVVNIGVKQECKADDSKHECRDHTR